MKDLVFGMEKLLYQQKAVSQLIGMLAFTSEAGLDITNFTEGIFVLYRMASDNYMEIEEVWKNNMSPEELVNIPHFYMQSGICYEKMKMPDKILMKMASAMLKKKSDKNDFEKGFEQAISHSYDISSESYAEPLIDYVMRRS